MKADVLFSIIILTFIYQFQRPKHLWTFWEFLSSLNFFIKKKKKTIAIKTSVHIPFNLNVQMYIFNLLFVILNPKFLCTI